MKFLIALDGSPLGESAVAAVAPWAIANDAEVHLLTVEQPGQFRETLAPHARHELTPGGTSGGQLLRTAELLPRAAEDRTQALERARVEGERALLDIGERYLPGRAVTVSVEFDRETPAAIIRVAEKTSAGVIAMGTRGRGGIGRALLGSVASEVVRLSPVPVLLVGPHMRSVLAAAREDEAGMEPPQETFPPGADPASATVEDAPACIPTLITWLGSPDWQKSRQAREGLKECGLEAVDPLVAALKSGNDNTRWGAVKVLDHLRDERAIPGLIDALEDSSSTVRWAAAEALVTTGLASVKPVLRRLLVNPGSVWLHEGAHHVLQRLVEPATTPVVGAVEGPYPSITGPPRANEALKELEGAG